MSNIVTPASRQRATMAAAVSRFTCAPKVIVPRTRRGTARSVPCGVRYSIDFLLAGPGMGDGALHHRAELPGHELLLTEAELLALGPAA